MITRLAATLLLATTVSAASPPAPSKLHPASFAEHRARCAGKDGWSDPAPPVRIFANVYDIGTCGITVVLVAGPSGAIAIDAATEQAVPAILANIRRLGLRPRDVRLLLSTHEHRDHAGGLAALQRATGARMVATAAARRQLETGIPAATDPQRDGAEPGFTGVRVDRVVRNGEQVALGPLRLTVHATPGHAPGSTSWSWRSCDTAGRCRRIVYADSVTAVSTDDYRFTDHPGYVRTLRATLGRIAALPCDLIITPHPAASDLYPRLAGEQPLSSPVACRRYAAAGGAALDARLAGERR